MKSLSLCFLVVSHLLMSKITIGVHSLDDLAIYLSWEPNDPPPMGWWLDSILAPVSGMTRTHWNPKASIFLSRESPKLSLRCPGWLAYPNHPQPPRSEKSINSRVILASYKSLQFTFTVIKTSATWSAICHLLRCRCSDLEWWLPWLKNYTWSTLYSKTKKENHWNWEDCWCFESESQGDWIVTGIHWHCDRIPALLRLLSALSRLDQVK